MTTFISDALLVAAVIGGPIVLAVLYVYGSYATRQMDRRAGSRSATADATRSIYSADEEERAHKEKTAARSTKLIDRIEKKTGTTG